VSKHVVVLGAGVAGLTAAQELVNRGFDVTVYDRRHVLGGKARSYRATLIDRDGNRVPDFQIQGEHGFRFFPGFYRHLDDTMRRIPAPAAYRTDDRKTVLDCLVPIKEELLAVAGHPPITVPASLPVKVSDIRNALRLPGTLGDCGLTDDDLATFSNKLWQIATSSPERRNEEYEQVGWRDFVQSKDRSDEYYWYLASGLTRALVAARARYASTKTMGNIALRLMAVALDVGQTTDRVLCGPTNEVWIDPWIDCITGPGKGQNGRAKGTARVERGVEVTDIGIDGHRVTHVDVHRLADGRGRSGVHQRVEADYFVSALPVETLSALVKGSSGLREHEQFRNVIEIAEAKDANQCLRKMSGLQIYLANEPKLGAHQPLNRGHQLLLDSPWGLTSISQGQFWVHLPPNVGGILSIDISSWDIEGLNGKKASACTDLQVFKEVCAQINAGLGESLLAEGGILGWHLDDSPELLLVNRVDSWRLRPTQGTAFENFKLAGDFVQTTTDLACMEGANEAARVAVNEILAQEGVPAPERCAVWAPQAPLPLRPFQELDRHRYERGLPWSGNADVGKWLVTGAHAAVVAADPVRADDTDLSGPSTLGSHAHRLPRSEWDDAPPQMPVVALTRDEIEAKLKKYDRYTQPGRSDAMFKRWRLYEPKKAPQYLVPLHVYDANTLIIYGKAKNFANLERLTAGTGYHPVSAVVGGQQVGFAELWIVRYNDTSTGPCHEVAINFVVNKDRNKPQYRWRSPYSALVPMMDPSNRLFAPEIIIGEQTSTPGCLEYGKDLFGMNKLHGRVSIELGPIIKFECYQTERRSEKKDRVEPCNEEFAVSGEVDVRTSRLDTVTTGIELAREMGPVASARNWQQVQSGAEIAGGLLTRDFREKAADRGIVEVKAAYKFAPTICRLDPKKPLKFGTSQLGMILQDMGFEEAIAAHEQHLKSVLYTDDCPTPDD
jgi:15-cis-phytoene desaturase